MKIQEIYNRTLANGGITVDLDGNIPTGGYMVSEMGGVEVSLNKFCSVDIESFVKANGRTGGYIGTWIDGETVYIDYSVNFTELGKALTFGRKHGQRAIYSLNTGKSICLY